jgi:thioredoxin-dependent peroxiredoxin
MVAIKLCALAPNFSTGFYKVATPANWNNGDDCVVVPAVATADILGIFPKGYKEIKPYLRMTPQPNLE